MSSALERRTQRVRLLMSGAQIVTNRGQQGAKVCWHDPCSSYHSLKTYRQVFICKFYPKE